MTARWSEEAWGRHPEVELARPPARPSKLWIVGGVLAWIGLPAVFWAITLAYLLGWWGS